MTENWNPPKNKTELMPLLRSHVAAFIEAGYRPTETRLSPALKKLWMSGTTRPKITGRSGLPIPISERWNFVASVDWDVVEFLGTAPAAAGERSSDRKKRITTYMAPPTFGLAEAFAYNELRRWVSIQDALKVAPALIEIGSAGGTSDSTAQAEQSTSPIQLFLDLQSRDRTAEETLLSVQQVLAAPSPPMP